MVHAQLCIVPLAIAGQALWSREGAHTCAMLAGVWPACLCRARGTVPDTGKPFLFPQPLFPCSRVIQLQLRVVFSDFTFKLIKGNCENGVLLASIEIQTEMAIFMSCDLSPKYL